MAPGTASSSVLLALVISMLLTSTSASVPCTALSWVESPETLSLSVSVNVTPAPPVSAFVIVNAFAWPVPAAVITSLKLLAAD